MGAVQSMPREGCFCQAFLSAQKELAETLCINYEPGTCMADSDAVKLALDQTRIAHDLDQMSENERNLFNECRDKNKGRRHVAYIKIESVLWGRHSADGEMQKLPACIIVSVLNVYPPTNGLGDLIKLDKCFAEWARNRDSITSKLRSTADDLDEVQHGCNISTTVGSSVGIASGIVTLVGISIFPPLAVGGLIVGGVSAVSNMTTGIVNAVFAKNKGQLVEDLFKRDEDLLQELRNQAARVHQIAETNGSSTTPVVNICTSLGAAGARGIGGLGVGFVMTEAAHLAPNVAKGLAHAAAGVGIGLDAITLILAAKDISSGSRSKHACELRKLADQAEEGKQELMVDAQEFLNILRTF